LCAFVSSTDGSPEEKNIAYVRNIYNAPIAIIELSISLIFCRDKYHYKPKTNDKYHHDNITLELTTITTKYNNEQQQQATREKRERNERETREKRERNERETRERDTEI